MDELILVDGRAFKCPSGFKWKKQDVSSSQAGRTDETEWQRKERCLLPGLV